MRYSLTRSAGNALSVVSWVMGTANRVKGRAVVFLSVDATHLLMASEVSDVVGMKAVPQTPQGPWGMYGYTPRAFSGSPKWGEFNMGDGKWVKMVDIGRQRVTIQMCHIPNT